MKKLAIFGCGGLVYDFIYDYFKKLDVRLAAICDTPGNMARFARAYAVPACYEDSGELLRKERPDMALVFPADDAAQFGLAKACMLAGADVMCERPVCHSLREGEELADLQERTGKFVMPRYNRRYMPAYVSALGILGGRQGGSGDAEMQAAGPQAAGSGMGASGGGDGGSGSGFGRIYMYNAAFHAGAYASDEAFAVNHVSHHLDLARMLLGEIELRSVMALREDGTRLGYQIAFEGPRGLLGCIQSNSFLCGDYPMERVEICGDRQQLIVENVRHLWHNRPVSRIGGTGAVDFAAAGGTKILNANNAQLDNRTHYGFEQMAAEFARCAGTGERPAQDMADALKTYALVERLQAMAAKLD
ncbi:MAG: Gfo/Idh/MocA family oxidoreductase [Clostridiales bacterium]|jgi:predicted dehydrogenase|nr:Gfo/Idh/MocA family oxidoreductase [Clostridiales bacterium]